MSIKVLVADDAHAVRKTIRYILTQDAEIELVGDAVNFPHAVRMAAELKSQIVIVDLYLPAKEPKSDELQFTFAAFGCTALAVSVWIDADSIALARRLGAVTLLDKANLAAELVPSIRQLANAS
jgi:two-component system, NarL family, invasion response regulator UvrY